MSTSHSDHSPEPSPDRRAAFVHCLIVEQPRLTAYALTLLGEPHAAANVVQEANLAMWDKLDEFTPGTNFTAWAKRFVYWQAKAITRDRDRDRLVFSDQLLEQLTAREAAATDDMVLQRALSDCVGQLTEQRTRLIRLRYHQNRSARQIAELLGKTEQAVRASLMRTRKALLRCLQQRLPPTELS